VAIRAWSRPSVRNRLGSSDARGWRVPAGNRSAPASWAVLRICHRVWPGSLRASALKLIEVAIVHLFHIAGRGSQWLRSARAFSAGVLTEQRGGWRKLLTPYHQRERVFPTPSCRSTTDLLSWGRWHDSWLSRKLRPPKRGFQVAPVRRDRWTASRDTDPFYRLVKVSAASFALRAKPQPSLRRRRHWCWRSSSKTLAAFGHWKRLSPKAVQHWSAALRQVTNAVQSSAAARVLQRSPSVAGIFFLVPWSRFSMHEEGKRPWDLNIGFGRLLSTATLTSCLYLTAAGMAFADSSSPSDTPICQKPLRRAPLTKERTTS